jgi:hypothetical protein
MRVRWRKKAALTRGKQFQRRETVSGVGSFDNRKIKRKKVKLMYEGGQYCLLT